jgi:hypothetical protein
MGPQEMDHQTGTRRSSAFLSHVCAILCGVAPFTTTKKDEMTSVHWSTSSGLHANMALSMSATNGTWRRPGWTESGAKACEL